jgi:hypothetical protein
MAQGQDMAATAREIRADRPLPARVLVAAAGVAAEGKALAGRTAKAAVAVADTLDLIRQPPSPRPNPSGSTPSPQQDECRRRQIGRFLSDVKAA